MQQSNDPRGTSTRPPERQHWSDESSSAGATGSAAGTTDAPETWSPRGNEFSSSDAPIGEGSNTPVGNEPSSFESWDSRQAEPSRERFGSDTSFASTDTAAQALPWGAGLAVAGGLGWLLYGWWQRRQERRSRAARLRRALALAVLPTARKLPKTIGEAAGSAKSPLLPLVLFPLALWLRSQGGKVGRAGEQLLEPLDVESRSRRLARQAAERMEWRGRRAIRENDPSQDSGWGWWPWLLALPVLGALFAAAKQAADSRGGVTAATSGRSVRDVMSHGVEVISPEANLAEAARKMRDLNVGSLPVCEGDRLLGMVTDRDISVRATAEGKDPNTTTVRQVMSPEVTWVFEDEPADMAATIMRQRQIRRLPVLDRNDKLVGIVALADLATDLSDDRLKGETLEEISKPSR